jgi:hypothetical protein
MNCLGMPLSDAEPTSCQNCDARLSSAYCPECGQRASAGQLSLRGMGRDFIEIVVQVETRLLHTVWGLLRAPQTTLRGYFSGRRRRYTHPFALLVIAATIYLLVTSLFREADWQEFHRALNTDAVEAMSTGQRERFIAFYRTMRSGLPYLMLLLTLPGAVLVRSCFPRRGHTVAEYWVVALYAVSLALLLESLLALMFLACSLPTLALSMSTNFLQLVAQVYLLYVFLRGGFTTFARVALVAGACFIAMNWLQGYAAYQYALWPTGH